MPACAQPESQQAQAREGLWAVLQQNGPDHLRFLCCCALVHESHSIAGTRASSPRIGKCSVRDCVGGCVCASPKRRSTGGGPHRRDKAILSNLPCMPSLWLRIHLLGHDGGHPRHQRDSANRRLIPRACISLGVHSPSWRAPAAPKRRCHRRLTPRARHLFGCGRTVVRGAGRAPKR